MSNNKIRRDYVENGRGKTEYYDGHGILKYVHEADYATSLQNFVAVVKMGHAGQNYSSIKVISLAAKDEKEFIEKVKSMPRVQSDADRFILSYAKVSLVEAKFVRRINDLDPFLNGANESVGSARVMQTRTIKPRVLEDQLSAINKVFYETESLPDYIYKAPDEYSTVMQRAYAPQLVESGDDKNRKLRVARSDKPLEGQLLYDYFKEAALSSLKRPNLSDGDRLSLLISYLKVLPKYKKYVLADENPFKVFIEKLQPGDRRSIKPLEISRKYNHDSGEIETTTTSRDITKEQYAITYVNLRGEKVSFILPDKDIGTLMKKPSDMQILTLVQRKIERALASEKGASLNRESIISMFDNISKYIENGELDMTGKSDEEIVATKLMCESFGGTKMVGNGKVIKREKWCTDYEGEFLGESFYTPKKATFRISDSEYQKFLVERRAKERKKFAKLTSQDVEPGLAD